MALTWLLLVLISFYNVTAAPPSLLSVEYTVKQYQSLDAGRQVAVLTGKLEIFELDFADYLYFLLTNLNSSISVVNLKNMTWLKITKKHFVRQK